MTSMPEVAAEWQNFDQLTADKLYELLRFRHDLCDSKRFLELGCTIPGTIYNPRRRLWPLSLRPVAPYGARFNSLDPTRWRVTSAVNSLRSKRPAVEQREEEYAGGNSGRPGLDEPGTPDRPGLRRAMATRLSRGLLQPGRRAETRKIVAGAGSAALTRPSPAA
jgi:hypothetical protein